MATHEKIVVLGAGQMGSTTRDSLEDKALYLPRLYFDLQSPNMALLDAIRPEILINCAAYTNVDKAESEEDAARQVNGTASETLARFCEKTGCTLISFSTDYVFDGTADKPYREDDKPCPINAYGRSKLMGDELIEKVMRRSCRYYILRTSGVWTYPGFSNFVTTIGKKLTSTSSQLKVISTSKMRVTYAFDLGMAVRVLVNRLNHDPMPFGIYNFANTGELSWFDFAKAIARKYNMEERVVEVGESSRVARRPVYSVLDTAKWTQTSGMKIPTWENALDRAFEGYE